jgi:hypothetical protein
MGPTSHLTVLPHPIPPSLFLHTERATPWGQQSTSLVPLGPLSPLSSPFSWRQPPLRMTGADPRKVCRWGKQGERLPCHSARANGFAIFNGAVMSQRFQSLLVPPIQ